MGWRKKKQKSAPPARVLSANLPVVGRFIAREIALTNGVTSELVVIAVLVVGVGAVVVAAVVACCFVVVLAVFVFVVVEVEVVIVVVIVVVLTQTHCHNLVAFTSKAQIILECGRKRQQTK